jgi:hypothetical protein
MKKKIYLVSSFALYGYDVFGLTDLTTWHKPPTTRMRGFEYDNEDQYIFFFYNYDEGEIRFSTVKIFNNFQEVSTYVQSFLKPDSIFDTRFYVSSIKLLLKKPNLSDVFRVSPDDEEEMF